MIGVSEDVGYPQVLPREDAMSLLGHATSDLELPETLQAQLRELSPPGLDDQDRPRPSSRPASASCVAFLVMFLVDRLWETPGWLRAVLFVAAVIGCANLPLAVVSLGLAAIAGSTQLARLLTRKHPQHRRPASRRHRAGQKRHRAGAVSLRLCEAAIAPGGRGRRRSETSATPCPARATGSGHGWSPFPRSSRARAARDLPCRRRERLGAVARALGEARPAIPSPRSKPLPAELVVPHGEPFAVDGEASGATPRGGPVQGTVQLGRQAPVDGPAARRPVCVRACPRRSSRRWLTVKIGDAAASGSGSSRPCGPS